MFSHTINRLIKGVTGFADRNSTKVKGSGNMKSKTLLQPPFKKVALKIPATVTVVVSNGVNEITVIAPENLHKYLKIQVKEDELVIAKRREFDVDSVAEIQIEIKVPGPLQGFEVVGSGVLNTNDTMATEREVAIDVRGSGKITLAMKDSGKIVAKVNGSGDISVDGSVTNLVGWVNGSGSLCLKDLKCEFAKVDVNGSGSVEVFAGRELDAEMTGSGNIFYYGNPQVKKSIKGSGKIVHNYSNN